MTDLDAELAKFDEEIAKAEQSAEAEETQKSSTDTVQQKGASSDNVQPQPQKGQETEKATTNNNAAAAAPPQHYRSAPTTTTKSNKTTYPASAVAATAPPLKSSASVVENGRSNVQQPQYNHHSSTLQNGAASASNIQPAQPNYQWQRQSATSYQQPGASAMTAASPYQQQQPAKSGKKHVRVAGGQMWVDPTLEEWPENDFRLFVGDIGNECTDEVLAAPFQKFPSFAKAKVVQDKKTEKTKGYGFVSFLDAMDAVRAMREVNGKYIGNRPCKIKKSRWKERELAQSKTVRKEQKMLVQLNKTAAGKKK